MVWALSVLIVLTAIVSSSGLYNVDEFIYVAAADALSNGSLAFENGVETFGSSDLKLWFFQVGPDGLMPQYPPGQAALGALLMPVLGVRWLILVNALASAATLFVTRSLARHMFNDERVALGAVLLLSVGTFWVEYAFGIWPHALTILSVTSATLFGLKAIDADQRGAVRYGLLAGVVIGAGVLVRFDTLLILPALAIIAALYARHRWAILLSGAVGLAPSIVVLSLVNNLKFGTFNPISYGQDATVESANTRVSSYLPAIIGLALVCVVLLLLWRLVGSGRLPRWSYGVAAAVMVIATVSVAPLRDFIRDYLTGAWSILVDARTIDDPRSGVIRDGDVLLFWGLVKKALGQSLPWLGVLLVLAAKPFTGQRRRMLTIALVILGIWTFPFLLTAWHGGLGSNMRYLLPVLPLICALGAAAFSELWELASGTRKRALAGAGAGVAAVALWGVVGPAHLAGAQQIMATYLFLATVLACLLLVVVKDRRAMLAGVAFFLVTAGFSVSAIFCVFDTGVDQGKRYLNDRSSREMSPLPGPGLFHGPPEWFSFAIGRPEMIVGISSSTTGAEVDMELIREALDAGYGVYTHADTADELSRLEPDLVRGETVAGNDKIVEVERVGASER